MLWHILFTIGLLFGVAATGAQAAEDSAWKAGAAKIKITPDKLAWLAGYAARQKPAAGTVQDLYAKALAIEDVRGQRLVIITTDLIGIPRHFRDWLEKEVQARHGLPRQALWINASHTHCGPEFDSTDIPTSGGPDEVAERTRIALEYTNRLKGDLMKIVDEALGHLAPVRLDYLHARCGFAMNRRRPTDRGFVNSPHSDGPVDHDVPVLRVTAPDGALRALLFGYACHNTTLAFGFFCGDYAGFAQEFLEAAHPGVTALFCTGCGGDQNPYPRSTLELARQHGRSLATAVDAALETVPRPLAGPLRLKYDEVPLEFAAPPSRERLLVMAESKSEPNAGYARRVLRQLSESGLIRDTYPCPVQLIDFGDDLTIVALAGEAVVDYSLALKKEMSGRRAVWVAAYSNDVFGYVPSLRVLQEGGYEARDASYWGPLPGPFAPNVEERIMGKVRELDARK